VPGKDTKEDSQGDVEQYIHALPAQVRETMQRARAAVHAELPGSVEWVTGWKTLAFGPVPKMPQVVVVIAPQKEWIDLGFAAGAKLPDPAGLLEGTGKSIRHVKLHRPADADQKAVRALLRAARTTAPSWKR
jgi:hypothetical protein